MTGGRITVVLASHSPHKLRQIGAMLSDLPIELVSMASALPFPMRLPEEGATLAERARRKAEAVKAAATLLTLADASGLEVDALGGRPGVRSARFAHEGATDAENNEALLRALEEVDEEHRRARLRCSLCLVDPWAPAGAEPISVEGTCEGWVARAGRGAGGFGYDSLFVVDGHGGRTLAELTDEERSAVSHRAEAVRALRPRLRELVLSRLDEVEQVSSVRPSLTNELGSRLGPARPFAAAQAAGRDRPLLARPSFG